MPDVDRGGERRSAAKDDSWAKVIFDDADMRGRKGYAIAKSEAFATGA